MSSWEDGGAGAVDSYNRHACAIMKYETGVSVKLMSAMPMHDFNYKLNFELNFNIPFIVQL